MDFIDEDDFGNEEEENETPTSVNYYIWGEELLKTFKLEGDEADK